MEAGTLVAWHKAVGDRLAQGDTIAPVDTLLARIQEVGSLEPAAEPHPGGEERATGLPAERVRRTVAAAMAR